VSAGLPAELELLRDDWNRLAQASGNVFLTWEWAATWWRHFGEGREPILRALRRDGTTVAILPLYREGTAVRTLRFLGAGTADQVGLVCAPDDLPDAAAELRRVLAEVPHDLFFADRVDGAEGWASLLGHSPVLREASPAIEFGTSDWDEFLRTKTTSFRRQTGKYERRLLRDHELTYRLTTDASELEDDLDTVFRLHVARWGSGVTEFQQEPARSFHRDFACAAFERGWLRIWIAELRGRPAAAWYGFRFGDADWSYQSGRDRAFDETSVAWVLTVHAVREAVQDGMRAYKFLLGDEEYKSRFANADHGLESFVMPRTVRGRVGHLATRAARRLRR
jgi:CelD/BcsL family acetyltransferase involved in cellulose biosynthesis